jgi:hypothetical protein
MLVQPPDAQQELAGSVPQITKVKAHAKASKLAEAQGHTL